MSGESPILRVTIRRPRSPQSTTRTRCSRVDNSFSPRVLSGAMHRHLLCSFAHRRGPRRSGCECMGLSARLSVAALCTSSPAYMLLVGSRGSCGRCAQEAAAFFKKRALLEEEYGRGMQRLSRATSEAYSSSEGKAGYVPNSSSLAIVLYRPGPSSQHGNLRCGSMNK